MPACLFVSDLHGRTDRYDKLLAAIEHERPDGVFLGGDLLPSGRLSTWDGSPDDFLTRYLIPRVQSLRERLGESAPRIFLIFGNDDPRSLEPKILDAEKRGLWEYIHERRVPFGDFDLYGYAFVPPTPFPLKDWERYDTSRYVDPGCISPEEGVRSLDIPRHEIRYRTIAEDLDRLTDDSDLSRAIFLFHTPPYRTALDRADLGGAVVDEIPVEVHVGSIALSRFIRHRQPLLTLHGHIHESPRLTGAWSDNIGNTVCLSAAHDGPELALISFDPARPSHAKRHLL